MHVGLKREKRRERLHHLIVHISKAQIRPKQLIGFVNVFVEAGIRSARCETSRLLTSTGLVPRNSEIVEDFSGVVGDGGLGFDRVTVDGDGDVA